MKTIEVINVVSCLVIFATSIYMLFIHYGSSKSQLEKHLNKLEYRLVKAGLIFMSMGTIWAMTHVEKIETSQVVLNVGLAFFMFWNSIRLNRMFLHKKRKNQKVNDVSSIDPKKQDFPDDQF